jgi:hypothetical protein
MWLAEKKDRNGQNYYQGAAWEDFTIHKGDKLYIYKNMMKKGPKSPHINIVLAVRDEGQDTVPARQDVPQEQGQTEQGQEIFDHPIDDPVAPEGGDESAPF